MHYDEDTYLDFYDSINSEASSWSGRAAFEANPRVFVKDAMQRQQHGYARKGKDVGAFIVPGTNPLADELRRHFEEVPPMQFYREIFPDGELDVWRENPAAERPEGEHAYTGIACEICADKVKRYTVTDDLDVIDALIWSNNFCVMSPISYVGKSRKAVNARFMYALVIEIDNLILGRNGEQIGLASLLRRCQTVNEFTGRTHLPLPTYIVASGSGVHLYYKFERPVPLFPNVVQQLKDYKRELTFKLWHESITRTSDEREVQQESIYQAFRMVGTITKHKARVQAFRTGEPVSLEYMNKFVKQELHISVVYRSKLTLQRAKQLYPEWYERRIVRGEGKKRWAVNRAVYDNWLKRIAEEARVNHRYYCMMYLVIYAVKCSIYDEKHNPKPVTYEELEKDCFKLMRMFESLTVSDDNHFTEKDVLDALYCWEDPEENGAAFECSIDVISDRSGLKIIKNKRNRREQKVHLQSEVWFSQETQKPIVNVCKQNRELALRYMRENGMIMGRPSAEEKVREWQKLHPEGIKAACIRETGLSKPTVYKWWK